MPAIERRLCAELRVAGDGDGRTVTGLCAPFYRAADIGGVSETFDPHSLILPDQGVGLHDQHPTLLDGGTAGETPVHDPRGMPVTPPGEFRTGEIDGTAGLLGRWRVPATPAGDALLQGISTGQRAGLSVGFLPNHARDKWSPDRKSVIRRDGVLLHVAAVRVGAHPRARVLEVRAGAELDDDELMRLHLRAAAAGPVRRAGRTDGRNALEALARRRSLISTQERQYRTWAGVADAAVARDELLDRLLRQRMLG